MAVAVSVASFLPGFGPRRFPPGRRRAASRPRTAVELGPQGIELRTERGDVLFGLPDSRRAVAKPEEVAVEACGPAVKTGAACCETRSMLRTVWSAALAAVDASSTKFTLMTKGWAMLPVDRLKIVHPRVAAASSL
jgi:hypothetical protein